MTESATRTESDFLGQQAVPIDALHGIHTVRAMRHFHLSGRAVRPSLVQAYGWVKLACLRAAHATGCWAGEPAKFHAMQGSCREMAAGELDKSIVVDALQGGAGTSLNLNVCEVLANRTLQHLDYSPGQYEYVSPLEDFNRFQSTNDTFPTALRLAAIFLLRGLEKEVVALQESFQAAEQRFAHIVKVGRTQLQDAVLVTLGREMSAYAEALSRDRWRLYKCEERLRVVNLGGTAIGTGVAAPREYILRTADELRELTGIPFARAENLVESTQNADVFVEVSGLLKTCSTTLWKICGDLRLLSSGPESGLGELRLPALQAGSSIMPGKVNPVIPEAVTQAAMRVCGHDTVIGMACASGSLELNPFLPLVADCLLDSIDLLSHACGLLHHHCIEGLEADEARCRQLAQASTAAATALLPRLSYDKVCELVRLARHDGRDFRTVVLESGALSAEDFDALTSSEAVCRLGTPDLTANGGAW